MQSNIHDKLFINIYRGIDDQARLSAAVSYIYIHQH